MEPPLQRGVFSNRWMAESGGDEGHPEEDRLKASPAGGLTLPRRCHLASLDAWGKKNARRVLLSVANIFTALTVMFAFLQDRY